MSCCGSKEPVVEPSVLGEGRSRSNTSRVALAKAVIIGESGVGKTSLLHSYVKGVVRFDYKSTIGADFMSKNVSVGGREVSMQIWDTAGQERFGSLGSSFFRGADVCLLVFALDDSATFERLAAWKEKFILQCNPKDEATFPFILVGNKADVGNHVVSAEQVEQWKEEHGVRDYFATSAVEHAGVAAAFTKAAERCMERMQIDSTVE